VVVLGIFNFSEINIEKNSLILVIGWTNKLGWLTVEKFDVMQSI
jgi:hypothetical protein